MDRGTSTVARRRRGGSPLPGRAPHGSWRGTPPPSVAWVQARRSTECPPAPERPRPSEGREPEVLLWADILGLVLGRLPRVDDRARLPSVCRAWRAAARVHGRPPLPLLVLSDFSFSAFCADGAMTGVRRIPLPRSWEMAAGVRCVGSFDGWLVGVQLNKGRYFGDGRCFLMNAFCQDVVRLPPPSITTHPVDVYSKYLPIANGSGAVQCMVNGAQYQYVMSFWKVVLSSSLTVIASALWLPSPCTGAQLALPSGSLAKVAASVSSVTLPCTRERSTCLARSPRTSLSLTSQKTTVA